MDKFWKLVTENKVVAVILAAVVLLFFWFLLFKLPGLLKGRINREDIPGEGSTEGNQNQIATLAEDLAEQLFNEMDGPNVLGHDAVPYENLLASSDVLFEATYRAFGIRDGETLKQWISNEVDTSWAFAALKAAIMARMSKLNLN